MTKKRTRPIVFKFSANADEAAKLRKRINLSNKETFQAYAYD